MSSPKFPRRVHLYLPINARKNEKPAAPQKSQTIDPTDLGGGKAIGKDGDGGDGGDGGDSASRPGSSRSNKLKKRRRTELPFGFGTDDETAIGAIGLPSPHAFGDSNYAGLRQYASSIKNGSTPSLVPSRPVDQSSRPGSSRSEKPKLDRIEIPNARTASPVSVGTINIPRTESPTQMGSPTITRTESPVSMTSPIIPRQGSPVSLMSPKSATSIPSKSPLGQFELTLNMPNESAALFEEQSVLRPPEPLRIVKRPSFPESLEDQPVGPSAGKPPSPPQSIRLGETARGAPVLSNFNSLAAVDRLSTGTGTSHNHLSADLDDEFQELTKDLDYGNKSIPTPPASVHQGQEGGINSNNNSSLKDNYTLFDELEKPILIKTVVAKRDTMTIDTPRRMSMEMRLEKHPGATATIVTPDTQPEAPPKSSARAGRPAALNLNLRPAPADMDGPRSAPFLTNRAPWTPLAQSPLALGNPPSTSHQVQMAPRYPSRLLALRTFDDETHEHELMQSPMSPESPVIPLTGPLASIRLGSPGTSSLSAAALAGSRSPPVRRHTEPEEDPEERIRNFRFPDPQAQSPRPVRSPSPEMERFPRLDDSSVRGGKVHQAERFPAFEQHPALENPSSSSPSAPIHGFAPLKRVATTNDLANWPLPSPSIAQSATPMVGARSPPQQQHPPPLQQLSRPTEPVEEDLGPLQPPRMPAAFAESSTNRARSFSRPWTPTNEPLKFEITTPRTTAATATTSPSTGTPKTATFPVLTDMPMVSSPVARTASASPHMQQVRRERGGGERSRSGSRTRTGMTQSPRYASPPPRSPRVAAMAGSGAIGGGTSERGLGLRSPGIVGDDFGGGFI